MEKLIVFKHDAETVNFDGLCSKDSNGKVVYWEIKHEFSAELASEGESVCQRGGFRITAKQLDELRCDTVFNLAAGVDEEEISLEIKKKCPPLNVIEEEPEKENTDSNVQIKRSCYFELEEGINDLDESIEICYKSCYANEKLYSRTKLESEESCLE